MTHDDELREHPSDEALAAWVDARIGGEEDLVRAGRRLADHLAGCPACRARVIALESVVASLRAAPEPPAESELARRRERVLAAIEPPVPAFASRVRRWWWMPTAAAAAVAVLLVALSREERAPVASAPDAVAEQAAEADTASLPVVAAAEAAAGEALEVLPLDPAEPEIVEGPTGVDPSTNEDTSGAGLGEVAVMDPTSAPMPGAALSDGSLTDEFLGLAADDQNAILDELAAMDFQL